MISPQKHIAVFFQSGLRSGGGFNQELATLECLQDTCFSAYTFTIFSTHRTTVKQLKINGFKATFIRLSFFDRIIDWFRNILFDFSPRLSWTHRLSLDHKLCSYNCDLVYFLSPTPLALRLAQHSYVYTLWDLGHYDCQSFPEFKKSRQFRLREPRYKQILPQAYATLVSSDAFKETVQWRYRLNPQNVHTAPFIPRKLFKPSKSAHIDILTKFSLSAPYIFYPAQFWAHKNHMYILDALLLMKQQNNPVHAVFSGSDKGNLTYLKSVVAEIGLSDHVHFVGFVDEDDMVALYQQSIALVMPTLMGPTNLPPLEAFSLGVPVVYSGQKGIGEFVEEAGFLVDLQDPKSLSGILMLILNKDPLVETKIKSGKAFLANQASYTSVLQTIFDDYFYLQKRWNKS